MLSALHCRCQVFARKVSVGVSVESSAMRKEEKRMVRNECDVQKSMMLAIMLIVQAAC